MCGIAGFYSHTAWKERIEQMNNCMIHRGPDAQEFWHHEDSALTLGHVRLSILDLTEAGRQPMKSHDERYVMVFNGEIYNCTDLRDRLISEGKCAQFRGHSDTEMLLEYICAYGLKKALIDSIGMFAIALFDIQTKELYLARDRMGEKPLYYGRVGQDFCFCSDIRSIKKVFGHSLTIDKDALSLYFTYGYIPTPYSIYKEINKLEPGSIARITKTNDTYDVEIEKYWDIRVIAEQGIKNQFDGKIEDAADELDVLIKKSVQRQMVADVPVGAFLSGGIDSSTVVGVMQQVSNNKVKTFSIGFNEDKFNEAHDAKVIADYLGTEHTEWYINPEDAKAVIPKLPTIYGEPFADVSQIPTYLVSKLAKEQVTVSLSGDGGDELFCGYNTYFDVPKLYNTINRLPLYARKIGKPVAQLAGNAGIRKLATVSKFIDSESPEKLYARLGNNDWAKELVLVNDYPSYAYSEYKSGFLDNSVEQNLMLMDLLMYHTDDILAKVDRAAMAVSLESRIPLLDRDIIEFAWTLPVDFNKNGNSGKQVLKNVLYKYVPKEIMDRPKKGFSVPIGKWLRESELRDWAEMLLDENKIRCEGILNYKLVSKTWRHFLKTGEGVTKVWYLLMFEEWLRSDE